MLKKIKHFRNEHEIAIMKAGNNVPNPIMRFEDGGFPPAYVMSEVPRAEFAAPTPSHRFRCLALL